jgi:hypothetical protein
VQNELCDPSQLHDESVCERMQVQSKDVEVWQELVAQESAFSGVQLLHEAYKVVSNLKRS